MPVFTFVMQLYVGLLCARTFSHVVTPVFYTIQSMRIVVCRYCKGVIFSIKHTFTYRGLILNNCFRWNAKTKGWSRVNWC